MDQREPALRGGRGPFLVEKWYLDTVLPDGSVLLVYLGWMRVFGLPLARVSAELLMPDGRAVRGAAKAKVGGVGDGLRFGPATLRRDGVRWSTPALSGELRFFPRHAPVALREPFLEQGGRSLRWTIEAPDADVRGEITWPGGGRSIAGRGYRDRVWFDLHPWGFPLRELRWGRAFSASHAATWVKADLANGGQVACGWQDGHTSSAAAAEVALGPSRLLVTGAVADLDGLQLGPWRPLLRRMALDPRQLKRAGPARLCGERGFAVHERVVWG